MSDADMWRCVILLCFFSVHLAVYKVLDILLVEKEKLDDCEKAIKDLREVNESFAQVSSPAVRPGTEGNRTAQKEEET